MVRNMIGTTGFVLVAFCWSAWGDYDAGRRAWDAGRTADAVVEWKAATTQGDRRAMLELGRLYVRGLGVPQSYVEAHVWFNVAASLGDPVALKERDAVAVKMTREQIATAQERALAWAAKSSKVNAQGTKGQDHGRRPAAPDPQEAPKRNEVFRDCTGCPEMVVIPAGKFMMGSPEGEEERFENEGPRHEVTIPKPLAVGRYEVTRGEFALFVSETGHDMTRGCLFGLIGRPGTRWSRDDDLSWQNPGYSQTDRHPVTCVSWLDAKAYVDWLSRKTGKRYRLMSEAEWEYAARAGTETSRYWGDDKAAQCSHANGRDQTAKERYYGSWMGPWKGVSCRDGSVHTSVVGKYGANNFGLSDMMGNVHELLEDCVHQSYVGAPADGSAWIHGGVCERRIIRGSSYTASPWGLRSAFRVRWGVRIVSRAARRGFRVARTLAP